MERAAWHGGSCWKIAVADMLGLLDGDLLSCCWWDAFAAFEEVIADKRGDKKDWITGAAAGTITGGFYAGLVGLQGAAAGAAVGAAVVFGREEFHKWRLSKGVQRYEAKYGEAPAVYHPTTAALVESQGPPRELVFPSLLPKSVKISDEEIERRIVARMDELRQELQAEEEQQLQQTK
ncbi:unnamed protein product [Phytophthora fragariaefolia]|uniref:Unnamed protein product n=1 Tax=Phytophthora fragariaefolia TaxID=1490495 RepID=A0A9W6TY23_9STRA|nr:unnamed protein product [Phytophthora fragariaefolia]